MTMSFQIELDRWDLEQLIADTHPLFRLRFPVEPGSSSGTTQMLEQITTEMKKMSDQNTQVAADVAQITEDMVALRAGFAALMQKISDLQTSSGNVGVPAALQAQIDDLHAFAQSVNGNLAPPADPAPPTT